MFSTGHLTSALALGLALGLDGTPLAALVAASVLTDWDYAIQLATGVNHRERLTHSPLVVGAPLAAAALAWPVLWWALAGSALHFALDLLDYGLRLNPFSKRVVGLRLLRAAPEAPFLVYLGAYVRDWRFVALEIVFAGAAAGLLAWRLTA